MRLVLAVALLVSGCTARPVRPVLLGSGAASISEATVELVNGTGHELPTPRRGLGDEIGVVAGQTGAPFSTADVFAAAVARGLREKGVAAIDGPHPGLPHLVVTLLDFEIRNHDTAGAVAFLSAKYRLLDAKDEPVWETVETRLPIRLDGPDLTRSEVVRIAGEAVTHALASFPSPTGRE